MFQINVFFHLRSADRPRFPSKADAELVNPENAALRPLSFLRISSYQNLALRDTRMQIIFSLPARSLILRAWHAGSQLAHQLAPAVVQAALQATQRTAKLSSQPACRWKGRIERNA